MACINARAACLDSRTGKRVRQGDNSLSLVLGNDFPLVQLLTFHDISLLRPLTLPLFFPPPHIIPPLPATAFLNARRR